VQESPPPDWSAGKKDRLNIMSKSRNRLERLWDYGDDVLNFMKEEDVLNNYM